MKTFFDEATGFEGWHTTPMREPKVKRYTVEHSPSVWDLNKLEPIKTIVHGNTHDLNTLEIVGNMQGECISTSPKLRFKHFDWVQYINTSKNPICGRKRLLFLAWRTGEHKEPTVLICKLKEI